MKTIVFHFSLLFFLLPAITYGQADSTFHWTVKLQGLFGQTTGPEFSANGAGYAIAYGINLSERSKLRIEHSGADLRGDVFFVTDMDGLTIGTGRQAFYKLSLNVLIHRTLWSDGKDVNVFMAVGPGLSYVSENTFSEINNEEFDGPKYKATGTSAFAEVGIELTQFIFSAFFSKSYYKDIEKVIDSSNAYLGISAGYKF